MFHYLLYYIFVGAFSTIWGRFGHSEAFLTILGEFGLGAFWSDTLDTADWDCPTVPVVLSLYYNLSFPKRLHPFLSQGKLIALFSDRNCQSQNFTRWFNCYNITYVTFPTSTFIHKTEVVKRKFHS